MIAFLLSLVTRHPSTPPPPRITRDYEWQADHTCSYCKLTGRARFIEWLPERVTTVECPFCGHEEELVG